MWDSKEAKWQSDLIAFRRRSYSVGGERGDRELGDRNLQTKVPDPAEELTDVLSRFTTWTASQRGSLPRTGSKGRGNVSLPEARELSYEEALRSTRFRVRRDDATPESPAAPDVAPVIPKENVVQPIAAAEAKLKGRTRRPRAAESKASPFPRRRSSAAHRVEPQPAAQHSVHRIGKGNPAHQPVRKPDQVGVIAAEFRQVLDASLSNSSSAAVNPGKSVWIKLRVSSSEQALIQARAAESRQSVSAYLRQCAFEVENLRAQVQRALLDLQRQTGLLASPTQAASPVANETKPGKFTAISQALARLFGRAPRFSARA